MNAKKVYKNLYYKEKVNFLEYFISSFIVTFIFTIPLFLNIYYDISDLFMYCWSFFIFLTLIYDSMRYERKEVEE